MEIDIRNPKQSEVTLIRFADDVSCQAATIEFDTDDRYMIIRDTVGESVYVKSVEHARNLIAAIEYAIDEWNLPQ